MTKPPAELPFMRVWVTELLGDPDVGDMTDEEFGIYMKLLFVAWKRGGIPADMGQRARSVKASAKKLEKLWKGLLGEKWIKAQDGSLVNPRQERERDAALKLARKRSRAGSKAAKKRWGTDANRMPDASETHTESDSDRNASEMPVQRSEFREKEKRPLTPSDFFEGKERQDREELEEKERAGTLTALEDVSLRGYRDEERAGL